jgi:Spy/CpxP family protein refolding chaperone
VKRLGAFLLLTAVVVGWSVFSFGGQAGQKKVPPPPPYFEVIQGLYINQLQQFLELTDDQYLKIAELLKEYLRSQYELQVPSRNRARNQLAQAVNHGASDEELTALTQEFDRVEGELSAARQSFLSKADPILQVRQRARLRLYMVNKENQIQNLIRASQNPATVTRPQSPPPSQPPQKPLPNQ